MNDQHPHAGYVGYDSHPTGSFDTDPLFGALPGHHDSGSGPAHNDGGTYGGYDGAYAPDQRSLDQQGFSGQYDSAAYNSQWDTGAHQQASYDAYSAQPHPQTSAQYDTTAAWTPDSVMIPDAAIPAQTVSPDATGQWDTAGWDHSGQADQWATGDTGAFPTSTFSTTAFDTGTYGTAAFDTTGYDTAGYGATGYTTGGIDTGAYDATAWNSGATPGNAPYEPEQTSHLPYEQQSGEQHAVSYELPETAEHPAREPEPGTRTEAEAPDEPGLVVEIPAPRPAGRSGPRGGSRGRRRTPAKRSALLTVAVPSACVMSVAGIAAASVGGAGGEEKKDETTSMAAADPGTVKPVAANNELDTQLANLSADAENFADRASRTQERIDLKARQAAEKEKREKEAARREALRPKYVLPVKQHGLSAYYGQAGVNWMSVHTGIDFPVSYGTPVMAATDGTVRTQWNSAYGNMAIVTAADGTETWYCHLSSTKIRSGSVQAGDVIAYSGNSGNSTGPHLHFEVRPGGGAAIDPMPWLRGHGINPG